MVTLYLIRHAEAVPPGDPNYEDDDRPLVPAGRATSLTCRPLQACSRIMLIARDTIGSSIALTADD